MNAPTVTDWIQAVAVCAALLLAFYQLVLAGDLSKRQMRQNAANLIEKGGGGAVVQSAGEFVRLASRPFDPKIDPVEVLVDLTPLHQHLQAWAICYDERLCDRRIALRYVCELLLQYEPTIVSTFEKYGLPYDADQRPLLATTLWRDCGKDAA